MNALDDKAFCRYVRFFLTAGGHIKRSISLRRQTCIDGYLRQPRQWWSRQWGPLPLCI